MDNPVSRMQFVEQLLQQDNGLTDGRWDEHREAIERRIALAARREKTMRIALVIVWSVTLLCLSLLFLGPLLDPHLAIYQAFLKAAPDWAMVALWVVIFTSFICAVPFLMLYVLRYRRALDRAQQEARDAALAELQRKLDELTSRLPPSSS